MRVCVGVSVSVLARERERKVFLARVADHILDMCIGRCVCVCVLEFQREIEIKQIVFECVLRDEDERGMEGPNYKYL